MNRILQMYVLIWALLSVFFFKDVSGAQPEAKTISSETIGNLALIRTIPLQPTKYPGDSVLDFRFTPDGRHILLVRQGSVQVIDITTGEIVKDTSPTTQHVPTSIPLYFSHDGNYVIFAEDGFCLLPVYATTNSFCDRLHITMPPQQLYQPFIAAALSHDNRRLYLISRSYGYGNLGTLFHVYDVEARREIDRLRLLDCASTFVLFNRDATRLICGGFTGLHAYDINDALTFDPVWSNENQVDQMGLSGDGRYLLAEQFLKTGEQWLRYLVVRDVEDGIVLSQWKMAEPKTYVPFIEDKDGTLRFSTSDQHVIIDARTAESLFDVDTVSQQIYRVHFNEQMTLLGLGDRYVGIQLFGFADCIATAEREINMRLSPSTNAPIATVLQPGLRIALVSKQFSEGHNWWSTGDGFWIREDVVQIDCPTQSP